MPQVRQELANGKVCCDENQRVNRYPQRSLKSTSYLVCCVYFWEQITELLSIIKFLKSGRNFSVIIWTQQAASRPFRAFVLSRENLNYGESCQSQTGIEGTADKYFQATGIAIGRERVCCSHTRQKNRPESVLNCWIKIISQKISARLLFWNVCIIPLQIFRNYWSKWQNFWNLQHCFSCFLILFYSLFTWPGLCKNSTTFSLVRF